MYYTQNEVILYQSKVNCNHFLPTAWDQRNLDNKDIWCK